MNAVTRESSSPVMVVGAGMAGLACAGALHHAGVSATVLDKSGDIGGRLATRRRPHGSWNHGATRLEAGNPGFLAALEQLARSGTAIRDAAGAWRGRPDMRELLRPQAEPLELELRSEVHAVVPLEDGWQVMFADDRETVNCDILLLAIPAPQARRLLGDRPELISAQQALDRVIMTPCWSLLLSCDADAALEPAVLPDGVLASLHRCPTPQPQDQAAWVAHATADWSIRHLELDRERVTTLLVDALRRELESGGRQLPEKLKVRAHRWRFARTQVPLGQACWWEPSLGLGLAGDWCLGDSAEHAWSSGRALAESVLNSGRRLRED